MYNAVVVQEVLQGDESLEDEERSGWTCKLTMTDWDNVEANLKTTQEDAQELNINHSMVLGIWGTSEKVKKLDKRQPRVLSHSVVSDSLQPRGL